MRPIGETEEQLLLLLVDAAEGQGDMRRARAYDKKVEKILKKDYNLNVAMELVAPIRREALGQMPSRQ